MQDSYGATNPSEAEQHEAFTVTNEAHGVDVSDPKLASAAARSRSMKWATLALVASGVGFVSVRSGARMVSERLQMDSGDVENEWNKYLDDDLFTGHMRTWSHRPATIDKMDTADAMTCDDWDDDGVYPTGKCTTGDATQCDDLAVYSHFNKLCGAACDSDDGTWGVPCAWEVIARMDEACDTIYKDANNFTASFPDNSKNLGRSYEPEYDIQKERGADTIPYTFNSSHHENWDACNMHGFCYSCVDEGAEVNKYCKAVVSQYKTLYSANVFFDHFYYWCDEVENIKHGEWNYTAGVPDGYGSTPAKLAKHKNANKNDDE